MTQISIGTWAFGIYTERPLDFTTVLDRIASLNFDGVEFGAFAPHPDPITCSSSEQREQLREVFSSKGLAVSAVAADFDDASFLRGDDASAYLDAVDRNLDFCADIGATRLIINAVDPPDTPYEVGVETAFERLVRTWSECAKRAHARGIALAWEFEPCWAFNEPEQIIEIAHELSGPGFGVLYDTAHAHAVSEVGARQRPDTPRLPGGQVELLGRLAGTISHVHLLDSDGSIHPEEGTTVHIPFGRGNVDFDRVIPALVAAGGATDWWCVDLCFWPDAWEATKESKAFVDRLLHQYVA